MLIYVYICHTFVGCIQHHSPLGFRDVGGQGPKMTPSDCYRPKSMGAKLKDSIDLNVQASEFVSVLSFRSIK